MERTDKLIHLTQPEQDATGLLSPLEATADTLFMINEAVREQQSVKDQLIADNDQLTHDVQIRIFNAGQRIAALNAVASECFPNAVNVSPEDFLK